MADTTIIVDTPITNVVTVGQSDIVVTTQPDVTVITGSTTTDIVTVGASDIILTEAAVSSVVTEGVQGPPGGSANILNVISTPTIIAADTSYPVVSYLTVNSDLTVNGNLMVIG